MKANSAEGTARMDLRCLGQGPCAVSVNTVPVDARSFEARRELPGVRLGLRGKPCGCPRCAARFRACYSALYLIWSVPVAQVCRPDVPLTSWLVPPETIAKQVYIES